MVQKVFQCSLPSQKACDQCKKILQDSPSHIELLAVTERGRSTFLVYISSSKFIQQKNIYRFGKLEFQHAKPTHPFTTSNTRAAVEAKEGKAGLDRTLNCLRITILVPLLSHGKLSKLVWYSTGTMNCNLKVQLIIDLRPVAGLVTYLPKQTWFWAGTVITGRHEAINNVGQVYSCNGSQEIITSLMLAISTQTGIAENSRVFFLMRNLIHL